MSRHGLSRELLHWGRWRASLRLPLARGLPTNSERLATVAARQPFRELREFTAILHFVTRHSDPPCVPCLSQSFPPGALKRSSSSRWSAALLSFISLNKQPAAVE